MDAPHEQYAVVSVCGSAGTLHVHRPRDATPRHAQAVCHARRPDASVCTGNTLITLSQPPNSNTGALVHHLLSRPAGAPSRRTAVPEPLCALALAPSAALLAAAADSGRLYVWHVPSGALLAAFSADVAAIATLAFTDDADALLVASADASIAVFATASLLDASRDPADDPEPVARLVGHTLPAVALAPGVAGAAGRAVSVSADRTLRVWHVASARCIGTVLFHSPARALAVCRDEAVAYAGLANGTVVAVPIAALPCGETRAASGMPSARAAGGTPVRSVALSPAESELLVGYDDGVVRVLDAATLAVLHAYSKHGVAAPITALATLRDMPHGSEECLALQRARDDDLAQEFAPVVQVCGKAADVDAVWACVDEVEGTVFGDWDAASDDGGDAERGSKSAAVEASNLMAAELMGEVETLQVRNKQLEDAARRALEMLEQSGLSV